MSSEPDRQASLGFAELGPRDLRVLWGTQQFYRVFSTVPITGTIEDDLFTGLRSKFRSPRSVSEPAAIAGSVI